MVKFVETKSGGGPWQLGRVKPPSMEWKKYLDLPTSFCAPFLPLAKALVPMPFTTYRLSMWKQAIADVISIHRLRP